MRVWMAWRKFGVVLGAGMPSRTIIVAVLLLLLVGRSVGWQDVVGTIGVGSHIAFAAVDWRRMLVEMGTVSLAALELIV
jgi:hypothetical protein